MDFFELLKSILSNAPQGLSPKEIREIIKENNPEFYRTQKHQEQVKKGNYQSLDHALMAQVYRYANNSQIFADRSQTPMLLSLVANNETANLSIHEDLESNDLDQLEKGIGTLYILGTNLYTKDGREIVKIGKTTGDINKRIDQLYTTGVPYRFRTIDKFETTNYSELERVIHNLFYPFRINTSREFFTEDCLKYLDQIIEIHKQIQNE